MKKAMEKSQGKNLIKILFLALSLNLLLASPLHADTWLDRQTGIQPNDAIAEQFGGQPKDVRVIVAQAIYVFLGFLGIIFVVYLVIAGFKWMNSKGDQAEIKKAREMITNAIIGLVIIATAWAISSFVFSRINNPKTGASGNQSDLNADNGGTFGTQ
jgi:hypothetical protein